MDALGSYRGWVRADVDEYDLTPRHVAADPGRVGDSASSSGSLGADVNGEG